ncbi:hypothetical protein D3C81_1547130 [compost metagenome]
MGPVVRSSPVFGFPARTLRPTIRSVVALARALLLSSASSPRSSRMVNGASAQARKVSVVEAVALVQIRASTVQQGRLAPHSRKVRATRGQSSRPCWAAWWFSFLNSPLMRPAPLIGV